MGHILNLTDARTKVKIDLSGRRFEILENNNTSETAIINVSFVYADGEVTEALPFGEGDYVESAKAFDHVLITNTAQAGISTDILVTKHGDDFKYHRKSDFSISNAVKTRGGNTLDTGSPAIDNTAAGTEIIPANSTRTGWTVYNPVTATENLLIGKANGCVFPVVPGGEKSGTGTYALLGKYATETNNVPYMEESEV